MAKLSKRVRAFREKVDANQSYPLDEAVALLKELGTVKFNETVEVAGNLGIDARKSDQGARGNHASSWHRCRGPRCRVCAR